MLGLGQADLSEFVFGFYEPVCYAPHGVKSPNQKEVPARYLHPAINEGGRMARVLRLSNGETVVTGIVNRRTVKYEPEAIDSSPRGGAAPGGVNRYTYARLVQ